MLKFNFLEALEMFVKYRTLATHQDEIKVLSDLVFYALTTLRGD